VPCSVAAETVATETVPSPLPAFRYVPDGLRCQDSQRAYAHPHQEQQLYFTDRGIEELERRRGEEEITFGWLAEQLRTFVDLNPEFEVPVERLSTWLARLDDEYEENDAFDA
jgi:hypothetical protein